MISAILQFRLLPINHFGIIYKVEISNINKRVVEFVRAVTEYSRKYADE